MKLLYKDQFRKIRFNLFNFISLSLLVMIISLTFTATKSSISRLEENYEPYLEEQLVEDFQFGMSQIDISYLGGTAIWYLCGELDLEFECAYNISIGTPAAYNNLSHAINQEIEAHPDLYEELIDNYLNDIIDEYDLIVEKKWMADVTDGYFQYRFLTLTYEVDVPYVVEGELPTEEFEIAIFPEFAEYNNIEIDDTYIIADQEYIVTAFIYSPDFVFPMYYMNSMDIRKETIVLTDNETIEQLGVNIDKKYVARGELGELLDDKTYKEVIELDTSQLGKFTQHIKSIKPSIANYAISTLPIEVENAKIFVDSFLSLFVVFIALIITIFLRRYIDKNKKDIETLQALGYTNFEITKSLMIFPFIVSFMSFIGYGLGLLLSIKFFDMYGSRYLYPKAGFSIDIYILIFAVIVPILFINIVSYLFIYISLIDKSEKAPWIKLKIFKFTPLKTIISSFALLLTISLMLTFGLNGNTMFSAFVEETKLGNNYYESIRLDFYTNDILNEEYEPFSRERGQMIILNDLELEDTKSFAVYGLDPDNSLKLLIDNELSNNQLLNDGIIISEYVKYNLDLEVGDEITYVVSEMEYTRTIVGITNELIENSIYMLKEDLNLAYNYDNTYYNGVYASDTEYVSDQISMRINYETGLDDMLSLLNASNILINFILLLSVILSIAIFSLVLINFLSDNRLNIGILKSIGHNNFEINKKYMLNIYIVFIITFIFSIPLSGMLFDLLLDTVIGKLGYVLLVKISFLNIVIAFFVLNMVFVSTLYFVTKYYEKISISEILKSNIK